MKLDSQNRLRIPHALLKEIGFEINQAPIKVRLAVFEYHFVLFRTSDQTTDMEYHDVVSIDHKGRFILKKYVMEEFGLDDSIEFIVSAVRDQIIIRWN